MTNDSKNMIRPQAEIMYYNTNIFFKVIFQHERANTLIEKVLEDKIRQIMADKNMKDTVGHHMKRLLKMTSIWEISYVTFCNYFFKEVYNMYCN